MSDMDGTLLGADSRVSARSVEIINELIDNAGLMFTVATSRSAATVVPLMADVHCRLPFITLSGAALWNPLTSRLEQVEEISPDRVDAVMRVMQRNGISPFVYRNHDNTMIYTHHSGELSPAEQKFVEHAAICRSNGFSSAMQLHLTAMMQLCSSLPCQPQAIYKRLAMR